ncbi:asparagine synthase (glutamine-hydrolyzing) [Sorangium sp. So ce134]
MCGIIAICSVSSEAPGARAAVADAISKGLAAIRHRGPDEWNSCIHDDGHVALGHTRLSVIDLQGGTQPISTMDGDIWAVVNGEFYDHERLRAELEHRGHVFKTRSDSEILLHLYQEKGTNCLQQLRGEFAFVLLDRRQGLVFSARDRFGIKPLFYALHAGRIYISSEIKALFAAGVPAAWNEHAYVSRSFYLGDATPYRDISSLKPGHYMTCVGHSVRTYKFWDFDYPDACEADRPVDEEGAVRAVHDSLWEAIALRMRADVPVALYLSGGLDSSAVLGIAARITGRALPAFTLSFVDHDDYNEEAPARLMAQHVGADFQPIPVTQGLLADRFEEALWHNELPFFNAHGVGKFVLSEAVQKAGYKVVLTGEGADEIFGGYPHFRRDMEAATSGRGPEQSPPRGGATYTDGMAEMTWLKRLIGTSVSWIENQQGVIERIRRYLRGGTLERYGSVDPFRLFLDQIDVARQVEGRDPVHVAMYLWAKSFLPNFVLAALGDRMEMAHHVEGRVPFLDHHLAHKVIALPTSLKIRGRTEKFLLREVARPYLPPELYRRKKHYFRAPPAALMPKSRLFELVQDTLRSELLSSVPFYDAARVRQTLDELPRMDDRQKELVDPLLMEMVSICLLQKSFRLSA